jgi:hypothetical protein
MPLTYATTTTANFIKTIHDKIGEVYSGQPFYDCAGTYVYSSADMGYILRTKFNYSFATQAAYNYSTVEVNIENNRPVILSGSNSTSGHMWVCDGYRTDSYYFDDCTGIDYLYFYMKWGQAAGQYNGWYSYNNFNPGGTNFNSNKTMIYNIIP